MKNSASTSTAASQKKVAAAKTKKPVATKKPAAKTRAAGKKVLTYEDISQKAYEIYLEREAKGEPGNPDSDWHNALDNLQSKK